MIPNLNVMLTFVGAALGTLMNIVLPVLFYNRAYNTSDKNRNQETGDNKGSESDPRRCIKIWSWIVFTVGIIIGVWGIVYCVMEVLEAKEDEV